MNHSRTTCRLCGERDLTKVMKLGPTPLADEFLPADRLSELRPLYPLNVWLCRNCGLAQLLDIVNPDRMFEDYLCRTGTSPALAGHFAEYAAEAAGQGMPAGALAVDIGSNDGTFLKALGKRGFRTVGVEPAQAIAALAEREGTPTLNRYFGLETARLIAAGHGQAHLIASNNVLANIDDLSDVAAGLRALLAPDGLYVLECQYLGDLIANMVFDFVYHEHLSYFSVKPLQMFFEANGLQPVQVTRSGSKGGSIRMYFQHKGGPRRPSTELAALTAEEFARGLATPECFASFMRRIDLAADAGRAMVRKMRDDGKSLACFGASPTTTTLVHYFGIEDSFDFYVDDNPIKIGRFAPSTRCQVMGSNVLAEKRPDFVFLAAWRHWRLIVDRNREYLRRGGSFIVPLPDLRCLSPHDGWSESSGRTHDPA